MNIFTHLGISREIMGAIESNFHIKLDRIGFMLGNIKPDLVPKLSSVPHLKNTVIDFVRSEIKNLLSMEMKPNSHDTREFSERLGLITHYLSDFFCYAHSEYFQGSILKHLQYEDKLSQYCRRIRPVTQEPFVYKSRNKTNDYASICDYIDSMHDEYIKLGSKPSYIRDMKYAMETTTTFCILVLKACVSDNIDTAA